MYTFFANLMPQSPSQYSDVMTWPVYYPSQYPNERIFRNSSEPVPPMYAFLPNLIPQLTWLVVYGRSQYPIERIFANLMTQIPI
jgi:hypothetical protein